ncbi:Neuroguidin-like [Homarus americanus]|uniref:Neuroguidin-like n=1 Tax=Homarus americanus TaxID=6706 RepID=A0A8J5JFZ4_HOMAM|nr:Neuroguidin-like [Homarus americanus]
MVERMDQENEISGTIASDLPRGVALLADLATNLNNVRATFDALAERIKAGELNTAKGLSLLELKNQSFLSYMGNLTYLTLRKLKGAKIEDDPSVGKHHNSNVAADGVVTGDDPSRLKGNIDNIGSSSDEDEEDGNVKKVKKTEEDNQKIYKVPKISQTHYDGEVNKDEAKEKARRRVLNSTMLRDALSEHTEDPEVVFNNDVLKQKAMKKRRELEVFEEENMIRKTVSRRDQAAMRQVTTLGTMGSEILGFNNMDALHQSYDPTAPAAKRQKTGKSSKNKGKGKFKGKKGFKKKRKH